jgi:hypothetical protein
MFPRTLVLIACLALGCSPAPNAAPRRYCVSGPEALDLLERARGTLLLAPPDGTLEALSLPEAARRTALDSNAVSAVVRVAGPDRRGRFAVVAHSERERVHTLQRIDEHGRAEVIFEGRGEFGDEAQLGQHVALDASGELLAFVARPRPVHVGGAEARRMEGDLDLWRIEGREHWPTSLRALDDTLEWVPGAQRLVFTAFVEGDLARELLERHVAEGDGFGRSSRDWKRVPVVHEFDFTRWTVRALHVGEHPLVAPDGRSILLRDLDQNWRLLDLERDQSRAVRAPGAIWPGAVAFVDCDTALYWARPTEGVESNDAAGAARCALKLLDLRNGTFQTVVPSLDPRSRLSYAPRL